MAQPPPAPSAAAAALAACGAHLELLARLLAQQKENAAAAGPPFHLLLERSTAALSAELGGSAGSAAALCPPAAPKEGDVATTANGDPQLLLPSGQNDSTLRAEQPEGAGPQAGCPAEAAESGEGCKGGEGAPAEADLARDANWDGQELVRANLSTQMNRESLRSAQSAQSAASSVARTNSLRFERQLSLSVMSTDSRVSSLRDMDLAARRWATGEGVPAAVLFLSRVVRKPAWELFWSALVALNCLAMVLEEEYNGIKQGHRLGVYDYYGSNEYMETWWPGSPEIFVYLDGVFTALFAIEFSFIVAHDVCLWKMAPRSLFRMPFWKSPGEVLDMVIVILCVTMLLSKRWHSIDQSARFLRGFRLLRLLRLVRLTRMVGRKGLDTLHVMTAALRSSLHALFYSMLLLCVIMSFFAMVLCKVLRFHLEEGSGLDEATKKKLFEYFGTYTRAMLSMADLTLSNWTTICRFLFNNVHEVYAVVVVLYKLSVGFAFVGVINGVFIQETFSVVQLDEHISVKRHLKQKAETKEILERLFTLGDQHGDGLLSQNEFHYLLEHNAIRNWLQANGLSFDSSDALFKIIAGDRDMLNVDEFVSGIMHLRSPARNIHLLALTQALKEEKQPQPGKA